MSSNFEINNELNKAKNMLLLRFIIILSLSLLIIEVIIGVLFFLDLYRSEKKILTSMTSEYQRILTYDSEERLIHVMKTNYQRLVENNIAVYQSFNDSDLIFISGDKNIFLESDPKIFITSNQSWFKSFILNPYISFKIGGDEKIFWLVLDNRARYTIAYKQWILTLYTFFIVVFITILFSHRVIRSAIAPLEKLGDLLDKLRKGNFELVSPPQQSTFQGLSVISVGVYDAINKLYNFTTTLNTTVDAIAHDIRTPLSRIILASQSALLEFKEPQQMREALSDCAEYAMQASNMLTSLMNLNDELTGKKQQQKMTTNINEVIKTVINWYDDIADEKKIKLIREIKEEIIIQSDPDKLTQILVNLVDNAIKYTQPNGTVSIEAERFHDERVEIRVIDTGIGIDYQYQSLIFERLYRIDSSRSNVEGYGIGLSMVAAMVDNLNGQIKLISKLGHGSKFIINLN
ncbi:HAMP domain-containing histidine kinase [Vibrio metschnikovii]|uniref:histidine kinase n=2 Tax=Unclassified Bacteria TaxID=49928 RepID=A0AAU6UPB8_UNCXX|nr:HAMP domain-containing histidine kinase [Vibrio metschnikovii]EKO3664798.1 HAMP domain-containing histidine kinase [Vibrio metschnikovii]EKO3695665.1 HAMP domain-containing histidine kinase [Vibrio metschnikovii]EKO3720541.1 HAMP domain-containing histidine kinase [Vibrio metschnikovii]EKO3723493.1 HAMP domain-containing histidine kinase [Vibrio metschnikovii]